MNKEAENKICQNCKKDFIIEPDDFGFYEKIGVPPPTFCPECRLQRRLAWMVNLNLFKRRCDLCGEETISMYRPDISFKIYCHKCWWSDKWDARNYAKNIDFSKPFLEQWRELLHETPILGLSIDTITGELSPYTNHCGQAKHCYMIFYSDYNEDCLYGFYLTQNKSLIDCSVTLESEFCYDNINSFKNYHVFGSSGNVTQSLDCAFLRDCDNCQYCFGSANLKSQKYVFFNKQYSKEEYLKKISEIDLGSYKEYQEVKNKTLNHFKKYIPRPIYDDFSENCTGSYIFQSKNCKECFDVVGCKDSKYLMMIKLVKVLDSYDYTDWGENAERIYECMTVGTNIQNIYFSHECGYGLNNIEYSKLSIGASNHFGCVSIKNIDYCILNKQYSKEEYGTLIPKIKKHMNDMPYIDSRGLIYKYGEFFPMEFSPHAYNNSFANLFFPKTKKEVQKDGLVWYEANIKEYPITLLASKLPDNIKDTPDKILQEIIGCSTCPRGYKIIKLELDLSKKLNVPLSRQCPFCRISDKVNIWFSQMKQVDRICDKCGIDFKTHYKEKEAQKVLCKSCYNQEVY